MEEARKYRAAYFDLYRGVHRWQRTAEVKGLPTRKVRTASGRLRRFVPDKDGRIPLTPYYATPIQGTVADGQKRAIALLHPRLADHGARLANTVHDELIIEVSKENAAETMRVAEDAMVAGMKEFVSSVPIEVTAKILKTWGTPLNRRCG